MLSRRNLQVALKGTCRSGLAPPVPLHLLWEHTHSQEDRYNIREMEQSLPLPNHSQDQNRPEIVVWLQERWGRSTKIKSPSWQLASCPWARSITCYMLTYVFPSPSPPQTEIFKEDTIVYSFLTKGKPLGFTFKCKQQVGTGPLDSFHLIQNTSKDRDSIASKLQFLAMLQSFLSWAWYCYADYSHWNLLVNAELHSLHPPTNPPIRITVHACIHTYTHQSNNSLEFLCAKHTTQPSGAHLWGRSHPVPFQMADCVFP